MKSPRLDSALFALALAGVGGCSPNLVLPDGTGGNAMGTGGTTGSGGAGQTGGTSMTGGAAGGSTATGGVVAPTGGSHTGGAAGRGGGAATGGVTSTGGRPPTGGVPAGGSAQPGTGGSSTDGGTGTGEVDCNAVMPTGGQMHSGNSQGGTGNLAWQIWSNQGTGTLTTFANTAAFSAAWNNSGDYLGRMGFEWGNSAKTYDKYGSIAAQFAYKKTGSAGGYSYIGIYGWSTNPCVEWYIVDDSFNTMPVNPGNTTNKGTITLDGGQYILYTRNTTGTGGSRCGSTSSWVQYYSVRKTARTCGTISITKHFDAWKAAGMELGNLLEAKILVEAGGGNGMVEFPVANVTMTP